VTSEREPTILDVIPTARHDLASMEGLSGKGGPSPRPGGAVMLLGIDMVRYTALGPGRHDVDSWLDRNGLAGQHVIELRPHDESGRRIRVTRYPARLFDQSFPEAERLAGVERSGEDWSLPTETVDVTVVEPLDPAWLAPLQTPTGI
jgi:hypothetical protein